MVQPDPAAEPCDPRPRVRLRRLFASGRALPGEQWDRHHRFVLRALAVLCAGVFGYALLEGHPPVLALATALPVAVLAVMAWSDALGRAWRASLASAGLMTAAALVVHLSHGRTEAHFLFFALLPLAALYATPVPFLLAVAYVALHHFALGSLHPSSVFEAGQPPLAMAALHAGFVLLESWACLVAWRLFDDRRQLVEQLVRARTAELSAQRDALARLAAVVQSTDDAVLTLQPDGTVATWNSGAERMYGYPPEEVLGRHVGMLLGTSPDQTTEEILGAVERGRSLHLERVHRRRDGEHFPVTVTVSAIESEGGGTAGAAAIVRDVTAQKRTEADALSTARQLQLQADELARLALTDPLTGLANRTLMHDRLEHSLSTRRARRHAVLLLDLDDFKSVNDEFGHGAGDAVLVEVARRLRDGVRPADTVARLGGDEFVVVMEDVAGRPDAVVVGERLLRAIAEPVPWHGEQFRVGCSIGITLTEPHELRGPEELLRDADIAMYVVKASGRNGLQVFERGMHDAVRDQNELARDLRAAIDDDQLRLLFQPQVDLRTGQVTGVEALTRWEHPQRGTLLPEVFIPVAESTGLIGALDDWALRAACAQLRRWDAEGLPPVRVAVNVSASRLTQGDLAEVIASSTNRAGVERSRLELEVTETLAVGPGTDAAESIARVRQLGVQVAIDDFGMGHSSFNRLRDLTLDRLKIDKSFVAGLSPATAQASVAGAMITVGRSLGMEVVAEGVETPEQLHALQSLGCTVAQGYLFGRPAAAGDLDEGLRRGLPVPALAAG